MSGWVTDLCAALNAGEAAVLVSVVDAAGSTPRTAGTRMVVTADSRFGTIGGGNLEFRAIGDARDMLAGSEKHRSQPIALGPQLGQCCGGNVALHFETIPGRPAWLDLLARGLAADAPVVLVTDPSAPRRLAVTETDSAGDPALDRSGIASHARQLLAGADLTHPDGLLFEVERPPALKIALFGAGHVGRALAATLATLPARLIWIDERRQEFPDPLPPGVEQIVPVDPADIIDDLPGGTHILIMTHSHAIDLALVEGALRRGDFATLGLIGSATKRERFERRLRALGFAETQLARLTCPIGIDGIADKAPGAIAIAAAAQILQRHEAAQAARNEEQSA